jgi:biopolymer transport protein ExbB
MDADSIGALLQQAGWTMAPLYVCSVLALLVGARKALDLRAARLKDDSWVQPTLNALNEGAAMRAVELARKSGHPAGRVAATLIEALEHNPAQAEAETQRVGMEEVAVLERNQRPLALIAEVAPLLGLLGTVVGMVELFQGISAQQASGSMIMSALSGGIWKALLTTAAGLTIAVPTLAAHAYFSSRIDRFRVQLTSIVQRVRYAATLESSEDGA